MKKIISIIALLLFTSQVYAIGASATAAISAANATRQHQEKLEQQTQLVAQIATMGGLTVDMESGQEIILCKKADDWKCYTKPKKVFEPTGIISIENFALSQGYSKAHQVTLIPKGDSYYLAIKVSK